MALSQHLFDQLPSSKAAQKLWEDILRQRPGVDLRDVAPVKVEQPLILYGAGALGRMIWEYCADVGLSVQAVIDRNADGLRDDPFWKGKPLLRPGDIPFEQKRQGILAVCVVTVPYVPLASQLREDGWSKVVPVYDVVEGYRALHPLSNGWVAPPLSVAEEQQIFHLLQAFADDQSRAHHLQVLAWRCLRQEWVFPGGVSSLESRFFIPQVLAALSGQVRFFDAGAHMGTVCEKVMNTFGARCEHIWAVEPDPAHQAALRTVLASSKGRWDLITTPLSAQQGREGYRCGLGYASQLTPQGALRDTTTIDLMDVAPTFLKLHLEGAEGAALRGAEQTLSAHRPVIAATSYHSSEGMGALPSWLLNAYPDGSLYTRLHSWCGTGAVLYALPKRR